MPTFYISIAALVISLAALFLAIRSHRRSDPRAMQSLISAVLSHERRSDRAARLRR